MLTSSLRVLEFKDEEEVTLVSAQTTEQVGFEPQLGPKSKNQLLKSACFFRKLVLKTFQF